MTDSEAITAVTAGLRCFTETTHWGLQTPEIHPHNPPCNHHWRTVACDSSTDVIECLSCGQQKTCHCTFDDDFA